MPTSEPAGDAGVPGWAAPDEAWAPGRAPQAPPPYAAPAPPPYAAPAPAPAPAPYGAPAPAPAPAPYGAPAPPAAAYGAPQGWASTPPWPAGHGPSTPPAADPAPAASYLALGRTPSYAWWKPLAGTVAAVVAWFLAVALALALLAAGTVASGGSVGVDGYPEDATLSGLAGLLTIAAALPVIVLTARVVRGRWGTLSSVARRVRWRWLGLCAALAVPAVVLVLVGTIVAETLAGAPEAPAEEDLDWVGGSRFLASFAALLVLVPLQSAAEEYVFRGWLVQVLGQWLRTPWPGIAVSALLFALAHGLFEVSGFLSLVWFALVMTWLTLRTGGLEAAVAFHAVNNLAAFTLAAAFGGLEAEPATAASASWASAVVGSLLLLPYAAVVLALHRRRERPAPAPAAPVAG